MHLMETEHFWKATSASLILTLLMMILPFTFAHSGETIYVHLLTAPVTIDGVWSAGEWADAAQYTMMNSTGGNIGYLRAKYNSTYFLIIIDSIWDTTPSANNWFENVWLAFDTAHNGGNAPQTDDYAVHPTTSWTGTGWVGTGTGWTSTPMPGVLVVQAGDWAPTPLGTSPNSGTPHKITEMAIPLTHVGPLGSTVGFYVQTDDDSTDPDGAGSLPPIAYSEWPPYAGGSPAWLPDVNPCPAPKAWGDLTSDVPEPVGGTWIPVDKLALLAPYIGLALTVIVAIAATAIFFKYRKTQ